MTLPVDGLMDERASYVALSRATALENLYMVGPATLAQLRYKPKKGIAATLDFLLRLDKATQAAFFENPSEFTPVAVKTFVGASNSGTGTGSESGTGGEGAGGQGGSSDTGGEGSGDASSSGTTAPKPTFLAPNSRNNCFHNAAVASTLAAFDGQPFPSNTALTPLAAVFFSAIQAVRDNMYKGALPGSVLVSNVFLLRAVITSYSPQT